VELEATFVGGLEDETAGSIGKAEGRLEIGVEDVVVGREEEPLIVDDVEEFERGSSARVG
jgi:hypothetical protein